MTRSTTPSSRRGFISRTLGVMTVLVTGGLTGHRTAAADSHLSKLDPSSATAEALDYTHDSPVEGKTCSNCNFFKGGDKTWGECSVFPGSRVNANGWCKSWIKQS